MSLDDFAEALDARLVQAREEERRFALRKREWVVLALLLAMALFAYFTFKRVVVSGISMEPTFHNGQSLIVWKTVPRDHLKAGDIIVFRHTDGAELVKRIVFIQNAAQTLAPPQLVWTTEGPRRFSQLFDPNARRPPSEGTIYVLGDNLEHSQDSRAFGPIRPAQIVGKVLQ